MKRSKLMPLVLAIAVIVNNSSVSFAMDDDFASLDNEEAVISNEYISEEVWDDDYFSGDMPNNNIIQDMENSGEDIIEADEIDGETDPYLEEIVDSDDGESDPYSEEVEFDNLNDEFRIESDEFDRETGEISDNVIDDLLLTEDTLHATLYDEIDYLEDVEAGDVVASGTCGENLTWQLVNTKGGWDRYCTLYISGTGPMTNWSYNSRSPWERYKRNSSTYSIHKIVISEGVTTIGDYMMYGVYSGGSTNSYHSDLAEIVLPSTIEYIGKDSFYYCRYLDSINIPKSVSSIGEFAFGDCCIDNVYISDMNAWCNIHFDSASSNPVCGRSNIYINDQLLTELVIPEGVTEIGNYMFAGFGSMLSIKMPNSINSIGDGAFEGCNSLTSIIIPNGVTNIGDGAFEGCNSLTSIIIPDGVTNIGDDTFWGCNSLTSIIIPDGVTNIGDSAFAGCSNLTGIILSNTLKTLGEAAFYDCTSLKEITIPSSLETAGTEIWNGDYYGPFYTSGIETVTISEGMEKLPDELFAHMSNVKQINLPRTLKTIGTRAFSKCTSLEEIDIPVAVTEIKDYAFNTCEKLLSIEIPDGVTTISNYTFNNCSALSTVYLGDGVTTISTRAFSDCPNINAIRIPKKTKVISDDAFYNFNKEVLVIYGYQKSYAETYASDHEIVFIALEDDGIVRGDGFNLTEDGHCVINSSDCFSYNGWTNWFGLSGYKIPLERYQEVFGEKYTKQIYDQNISTWGGNCFGMSATAAMFYLGKLPVVNYTHDVGVLAAGGYDEYATDSGRSYVKLRKTSELTKLIERYQIWQESNECYQAKVKYIWSHFNGSNAEAFSYIIETVKSSKEPILLGIRWDDPDDGNVGHRMVIDSSREPEDIGNGWYRLYVYDPNNPFFEHFGDRTPKGCYLQAENRFVELNVINGQWRMAATVNGDGASTAAVGYDSNGNLIPGSSINFMSARDIPGSFSTKATFTANNDVTAITYSSDNFTVKDENGKTVFQMNGGRISYVDNALVSKQDYDGYSESASNGISTGKIILPKGEYIVDVQNGFVSYSSDGDYAGIVAKEKTSVRNITSTELEIVSENNTSVNVVIEDVTGNEFISVKTDITADNNPSVVSVDDDKMTITTENDQVIDIEIISNEGQKDVTNVEVIKDTEMSLDLSESNIHVHKYGNWKITKAATCNSIGTEERICIECGEKETRIVPQTNMHSWSKWAVTKEATVLTTGEKTRSCSVCKKTEKETIAKLKPTYKINASNITLKVGQSTKKVSVTGLAKGDSIKGWSSSNKKIVTVTNKGVIKGKKVGKATITVLLTSGKKISIKAKVQKKAVATTKIGGLSKTLSIKKGKKVILKPVLSPITSVQKITYKSSNKKVVTVSSKGVVKAVKAGKAKITVTAGKKKFVITVTVKK